MEGACVGQIRSTPGMRSTSIKSAHQISNRAELFASTVGLGDFIEVVWDGALSGEFGVGGAIV